MEENNFDLNGVYVSKDCTVEMGAKIYAPAYISGGAHIKKGATVYPFCHIVGSHIGENTSVYSSTVIGSFVGANCSVGPYAYLREGAEIGDNCRIGDFVEVKASKLGEGTKAAHLAYIGDADVGKNCNIGCGVVFCNFDGKKKMKSKVGDGVFIGANCNLVAPVFIGDGAFIAAGTTITCDLEGGDLCIARPREKVLRGGAAGRYGGEEKNG